MSNNKVKKKSIRYLIPLIVPILTIVYGMGEGFNWWDNITGRTAAIQGYKRLISSKGYPKSFIFKDEPEFVGLLDIINYGTSNPIIKKISKNGISPSSITILAGPGQIYETPVPKDWPKFIRLSEGSLLAFIYAHVKEHNENIANIDSGKIAWVGTVSDLKNWINNHRNKERFIVSTFLIGLLSLIVAVLEISKKE